MEADKKQNKQRTITRTFASRRAAFLAERRKKNNKAFVESVLRRVKRHQDANKQQKDAKSDADRSDADTSDADKSDADKSDADKSDADKSDADMSEEIEAVTKAIEIISGGAVAGNAQKHLPTLMQMKNTLFGSSPVSLSQLRSTMTLENVQKASEPVPPQSAVILLV